MTQNSSRQLNFESNLRFLCNLNLSIAQTSRDLNINRQQINKYLNGTSTPSVRTLRRICDHFSVDESEIFLPEDDFQRLFALKDTSKTLPLELLASLQSIQTISARNSDRLKALEGKYLCYQHSERDPSNVSISVAYVTYDNGLAYLNRVDYACDANEPYKRYYSRRFHGVLFMAAERVFLMETLDQDADDFAVTMSIFWLSHLGKKTRLSGKVLGLANSFGQTTYESKVVFERLGEDKINKEDLKKCGYVEKSDFNQSNVASGGIYKI